DPPNDWEISIALENSGNTTATRLRFRSMRIYHDKVMGMRKINLIGPNPDEQEYEFSGLPLASISLPPHDKFVAPSFVITDRAVNMLRDNTLSLFVFGELEYFDAFENWHRTKFCYKFAGGTLSANDHRPRRNYSRTADHRLY